MALTQRSTRRVFHPDCSYSEKDPAKGRAKQQFRDDCDINRLIEKYRKLGVWPSGAPGIYEDQASWPKDLAEAFEITARAQEQFSALPAEVRRRLGNDPTRLLELTEEDLKDLRAYVKRQAAAEPVAGDGGRGGVAPAKEATPPKSKPAPKAKAEEGDQE